MADYQLTNTDVVVRPVGGSFIPNDPLNRDRIDYESWLTAGNMPDPAPVKTPVIIISPRQARLALLEAGLLDRVLASIDAFGEVVKITWEYATEVRSDDPTVTQFAKHLDLSDEQVHALFIRAGRF